MALMIVLMKTSSSLNWHHAKQWRHVVGTSVTKTGEYFRVMHKLSAQYYAIRRGMKVRENSTEDSPSNSSKNGL